MPNNAPGVSAVINNVPLGQPAPAQGSDILFVLGYAVWGQFDTPTLVTSWSDYISKFGGFHVDSDLSRAIALFFKNGGRRAFVVRAKISDANSTRASVVVPDVHGTPTTIFTAKAKYSSPGDAVKVKLTVSNGSETNTKKLVFESAELNIREVFDNFKITFSSQENAAVVAGRSPFNSVETITKKSQLAELVANGANAHTAPQNLPAHNTYNLMGGQVSIGDEDDPVTSLNLFGEDYGPGMLAAPNFGMNSDLITLAEATKRIAILDTSESETVTSVLNTRKNYDSAHAAMYYPPLVQMRDITGGPFVKQYSPVGAIAGIFAKAENEIGIHKAPANYRLEGVLGFDEQTYGYLNEGARETLNDRQINGIVRLSDQGIKVYGGRVLKSYGNVTAIHETRVLCAIYYRLKRSLQGFVFQPITPALFREIRSTCGQYMRELYRSGALYSPTGSEDDAYRVICDASNNPPELTQQHKVSVDVWVHLTGMAEQILIQINSVPLATDLDIITGGTN